MDESGTALGERILRAAVAHARTEFGENLAACYAIGSLAHGGFAPLVSDVDLVVVLGDGSGDLREKFSHITEAVRDEFESSLAERLSIFWSDRDGVRSGADRGHRLPAIDRLDLLESGRLLYGRDERQPATPPGRDELVLDSAEFALERIDDAYRANLHDPGRLIAAGVRAVTKATLFPVRFLYTVGTGKIGHNEDAIDGYRGPSAALVRAAGRWRHDGLDTTADALLAEHLVDLYVEFVDAYIRAAVAIGRPDLEPRLELLRRRLVSTPQ